MRRACSARSSATVNATVNPNSQLTTYHFEWGPTASYGNWFPLSDVTVGSDSTEHSGQPDARGVDAGHDLPRSRGRDERGRNDQRRGRTFTTPLPPPTSTTGSASGVDEATEALSATVDPDGSPTTYHFEVGRRDAYGTQWPSADHR